MRRFHVVIALGLATVGLAGVWSLRARAQAKPDSNQHPTVTIEQVNQWETDLSNWGRWGKDDERGALNLVTPQKEVQAARLVRDGVTVSLAHFASLEKAADNFNFGETKHEMYGLDPKGVPRFALDIITFGIHDGPIPTSTPCATIA